MERSEGKAPAVERPVPADALQRAVAAHSLGWLIAANFIGLLLAALLLWPELNDKIAPLTYGRWVPLHLDWQLYGWCALPLVGALFRFYLPDDARAVFATRQALWIWTAALLYGGVTWLSGKTSGKIFLEWTGGARMGWSFALLFLWVVLWRQSRRRMGLPLWGQGVLVATLAVPFLIYWAADPKIYPPVNPHSGGATGASLLGSTLVVVAIFGLLPRLLRLECIEGGRTMRRIYGYGLALSVSLYAGIDHGHASHHRLDQIVGMGSLLGWIPLVWFYARTYLWTPVSSRWLAAAFIWWLLLVVTGLLTFLPEISERLKFTNALVGHAHLAMAGFVTSLHVAILLNLNSRGSELARDTAPSRASSLPQRPAPRLWSFWLWQMGCAVQVVVLLWLGWFEGADPSLLYVRGGLADWCYGLRFVSGLAMFAASIRWLFDLAFKGNEPKNLDQLAGWLAIGAGALDLCTGLGLVAAPDVMLRLMGVREVLGDLVYLRFVGAFVGAVGASYLWASGRRKQSGDPALLRATLEITIIIRLAAGTFGTWAIWHGWLAPAWVSVPLTDFILAAVQAWLLQRGALAARA